jgi:predicted transcriptional regulator
MLTKTELINSLESLPENLTVDQVIDHIVFVEKVQKGLEDSEKGLINTKQEARKILDKWLK